MSVPTAGAGTPSRSPLRTPSAGPRITVVCLGNTLMADDGVGAAVGRELAAAPLPAGCIVDTRPYADMSLVGVLGDSDAVVVIDGIDAGTDAGAVFRFTPDEAGITSMRTHNSHGMGLGYAVSSARMLGVDPQVIVYAVQVADVRPLPDTLSAEVAAVVPEVAAMVRGEVERLVTAAGEHTAEPA